MKSLLFDFGLAALLGASAVDTAKIAYAQEQPQNIIYVDDDSVNGNGSLNAPFSTITEAVNNASQAASIRIASGTYEESVDIMVPVEIIGEDKRTTVIDAQRAEYAMKLIADNVKVHGLTFSNAVTGLHILSNHNTIEDCIAVGNVGRRGEDAYWTYDGNRYHATPATDGGISSGIILHGNNNRILENIITGNIGGRGGDGKAPATRRGPAIGPGNGSNGYGILVHGHGNLIENNLIDSNKGGHKGDPGYYEWPEPGRSGDGVGIGLIDCNDENHPNVVRGNTIMHSDPGPLGYSSPAYGVGVSTFRVWSLIENNLIKDNAVIGILNEDSHVFIYRNVIVGEGHEYVDRYSSVPVPNRLSTSGIMNINIENIYILNNTVVNSRLGVQERDAFGEIVNNIFYNVAQAIDQSRPVSNISNNCIFPENLGDRYLFENLDQRANLFVDPEFVDSENEDYRLRPSSPCIDAGTDVGLPFLGRAPDIGAFEFIPVTSGINDFRLYK